MRRTFTAVLTLCLLFVASATSVTAQDATPASATPVTDDAIEILLVQTATGGTIAPVEESGAEGATHELVLTGSPDQTIYFADRPNREVGTMPTAYVIEEFNAQSDDPPNAALVVQTVDGTEEIYVLELLSGDVNAETGDVTYQVALLADYSGLDVALESEPVADVTEALEFESSRLFIDHQCTYPGTMEPCQN